MESLWDRIGEKIDRVLVGGVPSGGTRERQGATRSPPLKMPGRVPGTFQNDFQKTPKTQRGVCIVVAIFE